MSAGVTTEGCNVLTSENDDLVLAHGSGGAAVLCGQKAEARRDG